MKEQKLLSFLQTAILTYDIILLVTHDAPEIVSLLSNYPKGRFNKKVLLLLEDSVCGHPDGIDCIKLDEESCIALRQLYHTYEFSNKFRVLSAKNNFGTIWNYIKTGILSPEEAATAFLL